MVVTQQDDSLRKLLELLIDSICERASAVQLDGSFETEIGPLVAQDTLEALSAEEVLSLAFDPARRTLLDFGCGAMGGRPFIEENGFVWHGVDYLEGVSPLVQETVAALAGEVTFYDGKRLPYENQSFDVVWAMLSLHHVQNVDLTFSEISRVLRPGGKFIGQTAYIEQVQDFSTFNYTPIGLKTAAAQHGMRLNRVFPKHDVFAFLARRLLITLGSTDQTPFNDMLDPDGYFHLAMAETGRRLGASMATINLLRLQFCTHFVFEIDVPDA